MDTTPETPTLRIFISSPGDVAQERHIAASVIGRLDAEFGDTVVLSPYFWEYEPVVITQDYQAPDPAPLDVRHRHLHPLVTLGLPAEGAAGPTRTGLNSTRPFFAGRRKVTRGVLRIFAMALRDSAGSDSCALVNLAAHQKCQTARTGSCSHSFQPLTTFMSSIGRLSGVYAAKWEL